MSLRRICALAFVCALAFGGPALVEAAGYAGEATNLVNGVCYWRCYDRTGSGSAPATNGRQCLDLCLNACGGPCIALY